jgi:hypothetical protein
MNTKDLILRTLTNPMQYRLTFYVLLGSVLLIGMIFGFSIEFVKVHLWRLMQP